MVALSARFGRRGRRAPRRPHAPPDAPRRPAKSARARATARSSVASASWRSVNAGYVADSSRQGRVAGRGGGSRASMECRRGRSDLRAIGGELWSRRWTRQSLKKLRRPNERSPCLQNAGSARGGRARGASPGRERGGHMHTCCCHRRSSHLRERIAASGWADRPESNRGSLSRLTRERWAPCPGVIARRPRRVTQNLAKLGARIRRAQDAQRRKRAAAAGTWRGRGSVRIDLSLNSRSPALTRACSPRSRT